MEEVRSTSILDEEIKAEARKKAELMIVSARETGEALLNGVDARIANLKAELAAQYEKKLAAFSANTAASLPLDKKRYFVSFVDSVITQTVGTFMTGLSEERRLELIKRKLETCRALLGGRSVHAVAAGCGLPATEQMLRTALGAELSGCTAADSSDAGTGVLIETDDGNVRCRLTLEEIAAEIIDENRAELAEAIFGGKVGE